MKYVFYCSLFIMALLRPISAQVIGTSFEDIPCHSGLYFDPLDPETPHPLPNQTEQPILNWPPTSDQLGFNAYYTPYDQASIGLSDGDSVGVTNRNSIVGAFSDGDQGYEISDCDGNFTLEFTPIDLQEFSQASLSIDVWIATTGYEGNGVNNTAQSDRLHIYVQDLDQTKQRDLLNTTGYDINDLDIEGRWLRRSVDISDFNQAQLVVTARNNTAAEAFYLDRIQVEGTLASNSINQTNPVIFPNPAKNSFTLLGHDQANTLLTLYDVFGHNVWTSDSKSLTHDVSMLHSGLYFLSLVKDQNTRTQKLIIE